jgi:hypothetical protein
VQRAGRWLTLAAVYLAVTLVMTWPIFNLRHVTSASYEGDARLIIWTLAWDNHAVLARLPLFESNIFYPAHDSLAYNEHLFGISLFTLPIYALTHNPVLAYNIVWLLSYVLCGLATHVLLRRYVASDLAAFAGSLVFTFSFYKMLHGHGHLQQIWTWLLPLSLLLLDRWIDRASWGRAFAWAAVTILQLLGSWYVALMTIMANVVLLAWRLLTRRPDRPLVRAAQLIVVTATAVAVVWPFARHYRTLQPASAREAASMSADADSYLLPAENTWTGQAFIKFVRRGPRGMFGERTMTIGWIALALAIAGIAGIRDGVGSDPKWLVPYVILSVVALLLSLGPPAHASGWSLYSFAAERLPAFGGFRSPARFGLLVLLGVSVFAALGSEVLIRRLPSGRAAMFVVIPLMLSEWFVIGFPGKRPQPFLTPDIYRSPQVQSAHALVSLPDYRTDPHWFWEPDYLLYSTVHWRPIVNGYGRTEPPDHSHAISHMMAFPGPNNARSMRELGVQYVVLHASRYPDGAADILRVAQASPEYDLVLRSGSDYLFRVR